MTTPNRPAENSERQEIPESISDLGIEIVRIEDTTKFYESIRNTPENKIFLLPLGQTSGGMYEYYSSVFNVNGTHAIVDILYNLKPMKIEEFEEFAKMHFHHTEKLREILGEKVPYFSIFYSLTNIDFMEVTKLRTAGQAYEKQKNGNIGDSRHDLASNLLGKVMKPEEVIKQFPHAAAYDNRLEEVLNGVVFPMNLKIAMAGVIKSVSPKIYNSMMKNKIDTFEEGYKKVYEILSAPKEKESNPPES